MSDKRNFPSEERVKEAVKRLNELDEAVIEELSPEKKRWANLAG